MALRPLVPVLASHLRKRVSRPNFTPCQDAPLIDPFQARNHVFARFRSLDRCDFRCVYLHVGTHDIPAEAGSADSGRAGTGCARHSFAWASRKLRITGGGTSSSGATFSRFFRAMTRHVERGRPQGTDRPRPNGSQLARFADGPCRCRSAANKRPRLTRWTRRSFAPRHSLGSPCPRC